LTIPIRIGARGFWAAVLSVGMASVAAQPVTLSQAVESAWRRAAESTASQGALQRAQADGAVASALWAAPPSLELAQRSDRGLSGTGSRETEVGVAVPL
jgi:hypothetical protein